MMIFIYNQIAIISIRNSYRINESMVLMRECHFV